jgi:hypothetical protein
VDGQDSADAADAVWDLVASREESQIVLDVAMRALGQMKDQGALGVLAKAAASGPLAQRARAIEALGRSVAAGAAGVLLPLLSDADAGVRACAATALGRRGDESVVSLLESSLADPEFTVRSAAVGSLGRLQFRRAVPGLCRAMMQAEGRLVDDIAAALRSVTGQRFGPDPVRYLRWYAEQEKTEVSGLPAWTAPPPSYSSLVATTRSRRILFVLSTSETMKDPVTGASDDDEIVASIKAAGEDLVEDLKKVKTKLDVARVHLRAMLRTLRDGVAFDVCVYSGSPTFAFGKLTPADDNSRKRAETRMASLSPGGFGNLHGALVRIFGKDPLADEGGPDTVVLLTDGALAEPGSKDSTEVGASVTRWNAVRQIRFIAIGVGQSQDDLLGRLAAGPPPGASSHLP